MPLEEAKKKEEKCIRNDAGYVKNMLSPDPQSSSFYLICSPIRIGKLLGWLSNRGAKKDRQSGLNVHNSR